MEGPKHNDVPPVIITFNEEEQRKDFYAACKDGLKKTSLGKQSVTSSPIIDKVAFFSDLVMMMVAPSL